METPEDSTCEATKVSSNSFKENANEREGNGDEYTRDGSLDWFGKPALKRKSGGWKSGILLLVNQGLASLAFVGVEANLVLFSTRVLNQTNAEAANTFSKWMGTVNIFSLMGAFVSDSYWGGYMSCAIFQLILILGLAMLSLSTYFFLLKSHGCGKIGFLCDSHSSLETALFYLSIYLIALGDGGYEPSLATFGADQFDEEDVKEERSKVSFYSYFYVAINLGSLFSETVLAYLQNLGNWVLGFWVSTCCALVALVLFLSGTMRYRHFKPAGNPLSRFCQVIVAAVRKLNVEIPLHGDGLYEMHGGATPNNGPRKILHTEDFRFLDRAAIITPKDVDLTSNQSNFPNPWQLCTVTQVEEMKCVLRLIPIWVCTIFYHVVFIQMASLFIEQGASMNASINKFHIPPASMTIFDIVSISVFIIFYDRVIAPFYTKLTKKDLRGLTELQRMGIGFVIVIVAITVAGIVELQRLRYAKDGGSELSSLSIFWQIPQYVLVGVSEAFMYVSQLEFFGAQIPDGMKSLGISLVMSSTSIGSYLCSLILTVVMKITAKNGRPGWVPRNLNEGHLDRFFFLLAGMAAIDLLLYVYCARRYKSISLEKRNKGNEREEVMIP